MNTTNLIIATVLGGLTILVIRYLANTFSPQQSNDLKSSQPSSKSFYGKSDNTVTPMPDDWTWDKSQALQQYPFKNGPYKLTMGIKLIDKQDWLLIEPNYLQQVKTKAKIVNNDYIYPKEKDLPSRTVFLAEDAMEATKEFYDTVINYLCTKYPRYFVKILDSLVHNTIIDEKFPASSSGRTTYNEVRDLELILARNIQEDFIILKKDPTREHEKDGTEYFFKAGIFAFAAGFNPQLRFNTPLSFVHWPIPGYEQKLKVSMNRFFDRIQPGQFVNRNNFSVQPNHNMYLDDSTKGHDKNENIQEKRFEDMDYEKDVHYRSERQTLTKLPKTGAVVFTIRTYLKPMAQVKADGPEVTERLIGAIKGFPEEIAHYKRSTEWGPAVIKYLQS